MPKRRKKKEKDAEGDQRMGESSAGGWKTGPASEMEGLETPGGEPLGRLRRKGEHMQKKGAKKRAKKKVSKALAVSERMEKFKSNKLNKRALRKSAKDLW
ncbi:hypothetical protein HKI87_03g23570 [Chloropicon roscoffensis]|uniref:Uncharacterized protein n=1 Tax=Chloropicon roscoffensis TaxID=1461544 RepID=A0AAX4P4G4_9CHLO